MNYKKAAWMSAFLAGALVLAGCQSDSDTEDTTSAVNTNTSAVKQSSTLSLEAEDYDTEINDAQKISLDEQSGDVKITKAGTYQLSGTLKNGSVVVDAKAAVVRIVLDNAHIRSKNSAPVYVKQADKVIITLPKGTASSLKDTASYTVDEKEEPSAALFSKDDLTINGSGTLDYDGSFAMNGGTLVAVGSSDMAMAPSTSSTQPSLMIRTDSTQPAETILYVQDEDGEIILGVSSVKAWQNVVISTGTLKKGSTYDIYVGGSASSVKNGVFTNAKSGTLLASMTLNDVVSTYGNAGMLQGPQGDGRHP